MHQFRVIPPKVKTAAPGDILLPVFANFSKFPDVPLSVVAPVDLTLPAPFHNVSTFPTLRITTGIEPDIDIPIFTNVSTFPSGGLTVEVAPDDETLVFSTFTNVSTFPSGGLTIEVAPADGFIRLPDPFVNSSSFPSNPIVVVPDDVSDDGSEGLGTDIIGGVL